MHRYMSAEAIRTFCFFTQHMPQCHNSHTTTVTMQLKASHETNIIWQSVPTSPNVLVPNILRQKVFNVGLVFFTLSHITPYYPPILPKVFNVGLEQYYMTSVPASPNVLIFWDKRFSMLGWSDHYNLYYDYNCNHNYNLTKGFQCWAGVTEGSQHSAPPSSSQKPLKRFSVTSVLLISTCWPLASESHWKGSLRDHMIVGLKIFQAQLMQVVVWGSNAYLVQADIDMIKQVLTIEFNISSSMLYGIMNEN